MGTNKLFLLWYLVKVDMSFSWKNDTLVFVSAKSQKCKLSTKGKFHIINFWIKEMLILWISGSKKRSFSTQDVRRKVFLENLGKLHMLRTRAGDLSVLKKTIRWYILSMEYHLYWLVKISSFDVSGEEKYGLSF